MRRKAFLSQKDAGKFADVGVVVHNQDGAHGIARFLWTWNVLLNSTG
jgi:hypothetical protein